MNKRLKCNILPVVIATYLQGNRICRKYGDMLPIFKNEFYKPGATAVFI